MARVMGFLLEGDQASGEPATVNQRVTGVAAAWAATAPSNSTSYKDALPSCANSTAPPVVRLAVMAAATSTSSASSRELDAAGVAPATVIST